MSTERPWLKQYPAGIPANINADSYVCLVDMFDEVLKKYKDLPAFSCMGATLTYGEIDKLSRQFGAYLKSRGLEQGDKIALMMPNLLQYPIALFGALRAGLIVVNTNPLYTPREMEHQFTDAGVRAIVIAENFASNLEKIINQTKIKAVVVTSIGEMLGLVKGTLTNFVVRNIKRMVPTYNIANTVTFKEALKAGKKLNFEPYRGQPDEVILLQYTGGTTGVAKGAMLTNKNLVANMEQIRAMMKPFLEERKEVSLSPLPLYHIFAFTVNCLALSSFGAHTVLITNPRDLNTIIDAFKKYPISLFTGVNTLFNALINNPDFQKIDFSSLKITGGGGMAVQVPVAEEWKRITGSDLCEGYGMTESSPVASVNPYDGSGKLGTIGIPVPSTDMRIVDEQGVPLPIGSVGEIQIKGPQVMAGYYNRPGATEETITDGWLNTGDIGLMDEEGYFKIVDRKKDMILVSGFNVYPNEIEEVLVRHPKILEVAAIGVPDPKSTEAVKVFIVKKDTSLTDKEVIAFARENLTGYKVPKLIEFKKELPKSTVGKILRRQLRDDT